MRAISTGLLTLAVLAGCSSSEASGAPVLDASTSHDSPSETTLPTDSMQAHEAIADVPGEVDQDGSSLDAVSNERVSCENECTKTCAQGTATSECDQCLVETCAEYKTKATEVPQRDDLFACIEKCAGNKDCSTQCCNKYGKACAFEVAYEMCRCGFREANCNTECTDTCSTKGLTEACGVCASQSPCTLQTFDYLFSNKRLAHQDCIETCTSSSLSLKECQTRCAKDFPESAVAYEEFLGCVCE